MRDWLRGVRARGFGGLIVAAAALIGTSNLVFATNAVVTSRDQQAALDQLSEGIDCRANVNADTAVVDYQASIESHLTRIAYYRALIAQREGSSITDAEVSAFIASVDDYARAVEALQAALEHRLESIGACR